MKFVLNTYKDNKYLRKDVHQAIIDKDPIIFIVPEEIKTNNVFEFIGYTDEMMKSFYVLDKFDTARSFAYLVTFPNIKFKKIMIVAPNFNEDDAKIMIKNINRMFIDLNNKKQKFKFTIKKKK